MTSATTPARARTKGRWGAGGVVNAGMGVGSLRIRPSRLSAHRTRRHHHRMRPARRELARNETSTDNSDQRIIVSVAGLLEEAGAVPARCCGYTILGPDD